MFVGLPPRSRRMASAVDSDFVHRGEHRRLETRRRRPFAAAFGTRFGRETAVRASGTCLATLAAASVLQRGNQRSLLLLPTHSDQTSRCTPRSRDSKEAQALKAATIEQPSHLDDSANTIERTRMDSRLSSALSTRTTPVFQASPLLPKPQRSRQARRGNHGGWRRCGKTRMLSNRHLLRSDRFERASTRSTLVTRRRDGGFTRQMRKTRGKH